MKKRHFLIIWLITIFMSCGPGQEEIRIHNEKIEVGKSIKKTKLSKILEQMEVRLQGQKEELESIGEFHFGRSLSTKQTQLDNQRDVINELEKYIARIEKEISMTSLFNSYEFQATPEGTIKHIFESAKNKDFSKMRHLLDPYGEYDGDALRLCSVEMLPDEGQNEWVRTFENGRVMGEAFIAGNSAEIEMAFGESSNRLEKIDLVKRLDRWYIKGF